jgi:hypothetical protein
MSLCFVYFSEGTSIISLHSIDELVFITQSMFTARYELDL